MTRFRVVFSLALVAAALFVMGMTFPSSSFLPCALAEGGCGQGSDECEWECTYGEWHCWESGNPFDLCECDEAASKCRTISCVQ